MKKLLVQIYYSKDKGILIVGNRGGDGPYKAAGIPLHFSYDMLDEELGEKVISQFEATENYMSVDDNLLFYKELPGIKTWNQFFSSMNLLSIWKDQNQYQIKSYRHKGKYYAADTTSHIEVTSNISNVELGRIIRKAMTRQEDRGTVRNH